jgi:plastocyanin
MRDPSHTPRFRWIVASALAMAVATLSAGAGLTAAQYVVSQKGREFRPNSITVKKGESITIVNDDADLRHHVYIDSSAFRFDSGDQEPGSRTDILFSVAGSFEVLCAIHPKMKLAVTVQ